MDAVMMMDDNGVGAMIDDGVIVDDGLSDEDHEDV